MGSQAFLQIDELTECVKRPQVGAKGLVYIKLNEDGTIKSSVDKFYTPEQLQAVADRLGLRDPFNFTPLWVVDFPLVEWDDETQCFYAMHHPFTAPKPEHLELFLNSTADRKE